MTFEERYNANYKKLLIFPIIVLTLSFFYLAFFYVQNGSIVHKDVSLTGGTSITIKTQASAQQLKTYLTKTIQDFQIKTITDNSGKQLQLIITSKNSDANNLQSALENFLGHKLTEQNSSIDTTSASLSADFYRQLLIAVILAFFWMSAIVFIIFSKGKKTKALVIFLNIIFGFFLGKLFFKLNPIISGIILLLFLAYLMKIYIKKSVPAFAVILSAFADIVMTLAIVDLVGMKISTAGIVAFLMLIGYSVDTDILLTTRLLKRKKGVNASLFDAFKTGITMTTTSIAAIIAALIVVYSFKSVLNQIFIILLIGLFMDILNTWITNASMIKWYVERK